ncbi:MAG: hypothetical protein LBP83_01480 [Dysgonamonadaceae bacterium]|jgi:hypothetical protein|nr:hypothetical protein [Dysgonamonadaceae bacterium]
MIKKIFISIFLVFVALQSCNDEIFSPVPYAPVQLTLDLRYKDSELNNVWAYKKFITKRLEIEKLGFGGILVINGGGIDMLNLFAYDLACPMELNREIRIEPDSTGRATCPQCKSVYNIANGSGAPLSGSKYFLKAYRVSSLGNDCYLVSN